MKTPHSGTLSRVTRPPEWKDTEMGERKEDIFMFNHSLIISKIITHY